MIGYLQGKILSLVGDKIILKTALGIGYIVSVNPARRFMVNENMELYILHIIREDRNDLYGFDDITDRQVIEDLLKVNGVGPKAACQIIWGLGANNFKEIVMKADVESLAALKGLGKKTAQKIILELQGVLVDVEKLVKQSNPNSEFAINFTEAMQNLGYKKSEIVNIISKLKKTEDWNENNLVETIKDALHLISKK
jgi:holliday junction DNA helicase RuvA